MLPEFSHLIDLYNKDLSEPPKIAYYLNPFTTTRYTAWLKKIQLAFSNPYGGVKTISK